MSLSGSLSTPSRLRGVADLRKSAATARESVLDVSSLKAKSERKGVEKEWLIRPSQMWCTNKRKAWTCY
jgi:hypothetical protein